MSTLADSNIQSICCDRLGRVVFPNAARRWGRMNAHQMICHLNDSFRVATGERYATPATNPLQRTLIKWIALHTPMKWPHGIATRPEIDQCLGGTPPTDWEHNREELRTLIRTFPNRTKFGAHPLYSRQNEPRRLG